LIALPFYREIDVSLLVLIAADAAGEIMNVYRTPFEIEYKSDCSPLTEADMRSHGVIASSLLQNFPSIPVLSEESKQVPFEERKNWNRFWLIDPLDGTKEFVNRNDDFTVNIALIENGKPVIGVVYVPVTQICFVGISGIGAFKIEKGKKSTQLPKVYDSNFENLSLVRVVASRSHLSNSTLDFVNKLKENGKNVVFVSRGSSLKLCMIAENSADVYPRFSPTMEWDTAAAQAVVESIGKKVLNYATNQPLSYNKESLENPSFIAY
jgi:3'(2'), 5'-bisphosphate nucleotidase